MIVGEIIKCSDSVYCKITKVENISVLFDIYKNEKLIDTREYFDKNGLDLEQVKRSMKWEFKNI